MVVRVCAFRLSTGCAPPPPTPPPHPTHPPPSPLRLPLPPHLCRLCAWPWSAFSRSNTPDSKGAASCSAGQGGCVRNGGRPPPAWELERSGWWGWGRPTNTARWPAGTVLLPLEGHLGKAHAAAARAGCGARAPPSFLTPLHHAYTRAKAQGEAQGDAPSGGGGGPSGPAAHYLPPGAGGSGGRRPAAWHPPTCPLRDPQPSTHGACRSHTQLLRPASTPHPAPGCCAQRPRPQRPRPQPLPPMPPRRHHMPSCSTRWSSSVDMSLS